MKASMHSDRTTCLAPARAHSTSINNQLQRSGTRVSVTRGSSERHVAGPLRAPADFGRCAVDACGRPPYSDSARESLPVTVNPPWSSPQIGAERPAGAETQSVAWLPIQGKHSSALSEPGRLALRSMREAKSLESRDGDEDTLVPRLKRSSVGGAIAGGLIGGGIGAGIGFAVGGPLGAVVGGALGALAGGLIGHSATSAPTPTLSLSGDTYTDTATASRKKIKFNVAVPPGHPAGDFALVNWVKGFMKDGSGHFFKWTMYGATVDANNTDYKVDSLDADPVYGSTPSGRWNYTPVSGGFSATDNPGPALTSEHGAEYALNFKIGLYRLGDVPTTTAGTIGATPIQILPWQYSVKVNAAGAFSHPAI